MAIFLQILSVVGFVLLIVLAIIAALIALILFLPVVYRVKLRKEESFDGAGSVRWLFGAVNFSFEFGADGVKTCLKIFGIKLGIGNKNKNRPKKDNSDEYQPAKKQPTIRPGEIVDESADDENDTGGISSENEHRRDNIAADGASEKGIKHVGNEAFEEKAKPSLAEKISFTFKNICDKLKKIGELKRIFDKAKPVLIKLIKAILPRKISGYIEFGFDDPANTGMLLAVVSALCIPIPQKLRVTPDFEEKKFNCDVKIQGRIFIIVLLINIIRLIKIPEIKDLIKESLPKRNNKKK